MKCSDILINRYADGELEPGELRDFEMHITGCSACRKESEKLRRALYLLRSQAAPAYPVPDRLWNNINRKLLLRFKMRVYGLATAAAAAALLLFGIISPPGFESNSLTGYAAGELEYLPAYEDIIDEAVEGDTVIDMFLRGEL